MSEFDDENVVLGKIFSGAYSPKTTYTYETRADWGAEVSRLEEELERDLAAQFGVLDNPKRHALYAKAYDHGHSAGHGDVYAYYADLVDLIKYDTPADPLLSAAKDMQDALQALRDLFFAYTHLDTNPPLELIEVDRILRKSRGQQ